MDIAPFLDTNLKTLAAVSPATFSWLMATPDALEEVGKRFFMHRPGLADWRLEDGGPLYGAMPPHAFYRDWAPGKDLDKEARERLARSATVIAGCGLGYGVNFLLERLPAPHRLVVVEPRRELLLAMLGSTDYSIFIRHKKLIFTPPTREAVEKTLQQLDMQFLFGKIELKVDVPCRQIGPEYAQLAIMLRQILEGLAVELTTMRLRQDIMVGNELANFQTAMGHGSISRLQGAAAGVHAVILGAGPSLAMAAPQLAGQTDNALMTTALQTLPALQRLGLRPHLCMAIDYSAGMRAVFDRLDPEFAREIPLLYSTKMQPDVVARYPGPKLPIWTRGGLGTFILADREMVLHAGGNVSVALFRLLSWFGVKSVTLAGQDFAWREEQSHVAGHHANCAAAHNRVALKDADGGTIWSTLSYTTALHDLAADIQRGDIPVLNIYGGGAVIAGAEVLTPEALALEGLPPSDPGSVGRFLTALEQARRPLPRPVYEARSDRWASSLRALLKHLEKCFKKAAREQQAIGEGISRLHQFLRQDPLYLPYLYNEIMDVGGLLNLGRPFEPRDLPALRQICSRVNTKVREMDRAICTCGANRQAA
ncbi:motility associated factor glycosyltransferase family protein [Megalodesulfovibrio paquesii]